MAAAATISAYAIRGPRRFGMVIGSEIMKKANNKSAPLPVVPQIDHDWPRSMILRATSPETRQKTQLMSSRRARLVTMVPSINNQTASARSLPH
jgi:hypothetical protein